VSTEIGMVGGRRRLRYDRVGAIVGRQSGKTEWGAARVMAQLLLSQFDLSAWTDLAYVQPQHVAYLAQTRSSAVGRWEEHVALIMDSPLAGEVTKLRRNNGEQRLYVGRSWYSPVTPSGRGPRGMDLDLAIIDEALTHRVELLGAVRPTMAQRDGSLDGIGAQLVVLSSAGDEHSTLLQRMTELGRAAVTDPSSRTAWLEWSAPPEADHLDETVWRATMPTLDVPNGITIDFLRSEATSMGEIDFKREYLGIPSTIGSSAVIPSEAWIDAPVIIDTVSPAATLIVALESHGIAVIPVGTRGAVDAAGMFFDSVLQRRLAHLDDWRLNDAVAGATKRAVGQRWAFDRRNVDIDITPLVAGALALWGVETDQAGAPALYT
jgi:hypothetical protein